MVDMNVIVLEGVGLYIVLAIVLFMAVAALVLAWSGVKRDEKIEELQYTLREVECSNTRLIIENWHYRAKFGSLDVGTTSPPPAEEPLLKEKP